MGCVWVSSMNQARLGCLLRKQERFLSLEVFDSMNVFSKLPSDAVI